MTVALRQRADVVVITIMNSPAFLPPGLRLEDWEGGQSGLALVLTLLSHGKVRLSLEQQGASVAATLELQPASSA